LKYFVLALVLVFFTSCGYQPSSKFARNVVGEKVSTSISISQSDPENSVIMKDSVDAAVIEVFHANLVSKSESQTHLHLSVSNPKYTPIEYDSNGYVIAYRTKITLKIKKYFRGISKEYTSKGTYDFSIAPNSIISDQERFQAIKFSATKAIESFLAHISAEGSRGN
jgi:hypothetical protein